MLKKKPKHIAIIMDGNGRWAQERALPRRKGHEEGIKSVEHAINGCLENTISYLTLYAFSTENWSRPKTEVKILMNFLSEYLDKKLADFHEKEIRFNVIGRINELNENIQEKIKRNCLETKHYSKLVFTLALNYSSRAEIIDAVKKIIVESKSEDINLKNVDEDYIKEHLYTSNLPDPDILIRTSGELRISNFLLWQLSYTELFFIDKFWPDFKSHDVESIINQYQLRNRRFGKI